MGLLFQGRLLICRRTDRVLNFPAAEFFYESPDIAVAVVVPQGELIPKEDESFNHTARVCRVGADNKIYITLGQPFNVPAKSKMDGFTKHGIGGIIRIDQDGKNREVYATGIRNSVGMDFNPKNNQLWFTDNQVDGMGDNIPPGELNRATDRPKFRLPLLWWRQGQDCRVQGRYSARKCHLS
jgi:glucose/arabinose dehydrogenase